MKAIIFGVNGQDGFYLNSLLQEHNITVIGVSRSNNKYIIGDVANSAFVERLVISEQPDYIFHLAANSTTRHDALFENHETISTGTLNILEAVYKHSKGTKVFISGSGLQFVNNGSPISENDPFEARDPYCVSRIHSVYAARYYRTLGIKVYVGYFFNHDSPLRSERHVNQKVVMGVKRIVEGSTEKIVMGDVEVKKEFTFAGDVAKAILLLVQNDEVYESVIGSGKAYSIKDWIELCFGYFNLNWKDYIITERLFKREYDILVSNPSTLLGLGWTQEVDIQQLAKLFIIYNND